MSNRSVENLFWNPLLFEDEILLFINELIPRNKKIDTINNTMNCLIFNFLIFNTINEKFAKNNAKTAPAFRVAKIEKIDKARGEIIPFL